MIPQPAGARLVVVGRMGMATTDPSPFRGAGCAGEAEFHLVRLDEKTYRLAKQFCYVEPVADQPLRVGKEEEFGAPVTSSGPRTFTVPPAGTTMITDLASVPPFLTWLVPKDGRHTPAALLHDGLMPKTPRLYQGPSLDRVEADRIFRNAMQHLDVAFLRRWAMWAAVSLATFCGMRPDFAGVWRRVGSWVRSAIIGLVTIILLTVGFAAWADLFDQSISTPCDIQVVNRTLPCIHHGLPGMRSQWWLRELLGLLSLTIKVSVLLGLAAAFVRLVSELFNRRRSWVRSLTFVIFAATLLLFAVPIVFAAVGWAGYFVMEGVVFVVLWPVGWLLKELGGHPLERFAGPVNPPRILRS